MKHPILRLVLALLAVAAAGGAGYYVFTLEQRAAALQTAERGFGEDVLRLQATLADLRAAQAGYLAIGQDAAVWIQKAAQLRQQADTQLRRLTAAAAAGLDLDADLATVGEGLASSGRFDRQITNLMRDEQTLAASALIFNDSAQVVAATTAALSKLRGTHGSKTGAAVMALRQQQLYAAAGASLVVLLVLLLLVPVRRRAEQAEEDDQPVPASDTTLFAPVPQPPAAHVGVGADLDLALERRTSRSQDVEREWASEARDLEPGAWREMAAADAASAVDLDMSHLAPEPEPAPVSRLPAVSAGTKVQVVEPTAAPLKVDLSAAAQLCTDLARVRDTSELQGLLARAAGLLDATGIVVWMGGSDGKVLWPAFSHGYTPHALSKMQALPRDGGTPVSLAFRTGLMEVIPAADAGTSGAIVAPILTSTGCVGVMAVEIRHGAESSDAEQALAGILAAQLATLVAGDTASE